MPDEERPAGSCLLHPPPREGRPWARADDGYRTCSGCLDRLRETLGEVNRRFHLLDPAPGQSGEPSGRGAPGFGSRSPASEHVIAMRDPRSSRTAKVWKAADGKFHTEQERPPLSVPGELDTLAWGIADERGIDGPKSLAVADLVRWIDAQLDWVTRRDSVVALALQLRELSAQLKPVTGEPGRRHIGLCPNVLDEGEHSRECEARLYAPLRGDEISCRACGRVWPREEWLRLGNLLEAS